MEELTFSRRTTDPSRPSAITDRSRALLDSADGYIYKEVNGHELGAYVFRPLQVEAPADGWPVGIYFYSSTWDHGQASQFAPHAMYFSSRGMIGILIDYRVTSRHGGSAVDAMRDARSAMRWVRAHSGDLHINPNRIVGIGGGAGAHAIMAAAMLPDFDDASDDVSISCAPNALIAFSPVTDTSRKKGVGYDRFPDQKTARKANLMRAVRRHLPPTLLIHGTADRVVPFENTKRFQRKNWWRRNHCVLRAYEALGHGFYNFNVDVQKYELTLVEMDTFLTKRGIIASNPDDDGVPRLS